MDTAAGSAQSNVSLYVERINRGLVEGQELVAQLNQRLVNVMDTESPDPPIAKADGPAVKMPEPSCALSSQMNDLGSMVHAINHSLHQVVRRLQV